MVVAVHHFCTGAFTGHVFNLIVGYCSRLAAGVFSLPPSTAVQHSGEEDMVAECTLCYFCFQAWRWHGAKLDVLLRSLTSQQQPYRPDVLALESQKVRGTVSACISCAHLSPPWWNFIWFWFICDDSVIQKLKTERSCKWFRASTLTEKYVLRELNFAFIMWS